ncbi:lipopolysaccharide biosynthesis protein [Streptomyces sp. S.PNR 29]|uniref:lipopolysaccharide biosynthesis protein n=1 Tax=Streptomyces sp. S.PNR 29 TaxID=2973805 RepID=UPI0025B0C18A|nr:lipopolysaccharide biosynthesis protein [Streptomyces sp. S.PNR 29]MDN0193636.1 lipopolysaccharide biosynthesis protein [Streptomyces sp. S.PNR 29]
MAETQVHETAAAPADGGSKAPGNRSGGADSLFKNAYFLMLSTGVSAVLGLGFWLVAARYYSEEAVGQGSAAIAAMRLLASITATTMIGAVVRFVPRAGRETGSLVWRTYAASSVVVTLAAVVFLLTLDLWGASYAPLGTPAAGALFVAACVSWALLTLQDGVLTGLRKAEWVPAGNAVFSVGKLVLLAVFAGTLPVLGIFVSWAVAIAFSTLPLGWLIFRRLIPRQAAADRDLEPPGLREMGRFLAGDSLGALFSLAMINLLPVMVAVRFSAAENGYFYVAYTVGGTMEFMAINMASSLTAHASHDPRRLADGVRGALRRMTLLLVPVVLVLVLFAPQILAPFHPDYAEHGSTVLRLLALGALPRVVVELYIGVLRVQGRTGVLAAVQGVMCALVLGSAAMLFTPAGIAGAGWAVLLSMTVVAALCAPGLRSALRGIGGADRATAGAVGTPAYGTRWAKLNATAGYGTSWARRAAYEHEQPDQDTVTLFIGRPGYEREALEADTLAVIVRPPQPHTGAPAGRDGRTGSGTPAQPNAPAPEEGTGERALRPALWALLATATALFCAALRDLPWLSGAPEAALSGREVLDGLPLTALAAGTVLLLVFVAAVTLSARREPWLPGAALGAVVLALYAAPVALGREPRAVEGTWYSKTAGFLADAMWLDGPEPLLRWAPLVCQPLCLVPLWLLLARAGGRLPWPGRWGVLYLAAVGGWVGQHALAPYAPPLLLLLVLVALLVSPRRPAPTTSAPTTEPPHRTRPNGRSRD